MDLAANFDLSLSRMGKDDPGEIDEVRDGEPEHAPVVNDDPDAHERRGHPRGDGQPGAIPHQSTLGTGTRRRMFSTTSCGPIRFDHSSGLRISR